MDIENRKKKKKKGPAWKLIPTGYDSHNNMQVQIIKYKNYTYLQLKDHQTLFSTMFS